jgi:hypothetical protein
MTMLFNLANGLSTGTVAIQAPKLLNVTPFLGGQGHNAILQLQAAPAAGATVLIQGNPSNAHTTPPDNDPGWTTIATLTSTSPLQQEITLPQWIRTNVTVLTAGTLTANLEGVQ